MSKTGKCQCGAISYEVTGQPAHSAACWCDDCRASAGATPVVWTLFPDDAIRISGTPVSYESSPGSTRQFCGKCGTGMFFLSETIFPNQTDIQAGTFDDKDAFPPQAHIQVADAPKWQATQGELPTFERFPG